MREKKYLQESKRGYWRISRYIFLIFFYDFFQKKKKFKMKDKRKIEIRSTVKIEKNIKNMVRIFLKRDVKKKLDKGWMGG